jgi:hypothetical protein
MKESTGMAYEFLAERLPDEGSYAARFEGIDERETKFGDRIMWSFRIITADGPSVVTGWTSTKFTSMTKAGKWLAALTGGDVQPGPVDPNLFNGKPVKVTVEHAGEDDVRATVTKVSAADPAPPGQLAAPAVADIDPAVLAAAVAAVRGQQDDSAPF